MLAAVFGTRSRLGEVGIGAFEVASSIPVRKLIGEVAVKIGTLRRVVGSLAFYSAFVRVAVGVIPVFVGHISKLGLRMRPGQRAVALYR